MKISSRTLLLGVAACAGLFCLILVLAYLSTLFMHLLEARAKARLGQRKKPREILAFHGPAPEEREAT